MRACRLALLHHNEKDEWLRYGAGIFLIDVQGGEVRGNMARRGMNGLQLVRSVQLRIWNNDFSYLSGLGIGLYRSGWNTIMHNRLDYCVRGYVHGVYRRGQDSAALLLYEQSSDNVVAYNSMTHSGDGVFLWAGQSTMDSGKGGANGNLFFGNDVSFSVANGIEATFSSNRFIANLSEGSQYGVWGGYSWGSEFRDNTFRGNVTGIAIEHGQDNVIHGNIFDRDSTAIRLWWNRLEPSDWGYPKQRDTRSRDYRIESNRFSANTVAVRLENSTNVRFDRNRYAGVDTALITSSETGGTQAETAPDTPTRDVVTTSGDVDLRPWVPDYAHPDAPQPIPGGMTAMMSLGALRGRETILVDEWGPYDGQQPQLWPHHLGDSSYTGADGAPGHWPAGTLGGEKHRGLARVSGMAGLQGDTLVVTPSPAP
jgi:nitrous oxidase accessory protein NosD